MYLVINKQEINFKDVDPNLLYKRLCKSSYRIDNIGKEFQHSIFYLNDHLNEVGKLLSSDSNQKSRCLNFDIERTRRIQKIISKNIPDKIQKIIIEKETITKQSFRLTTDQIKKSEQKLFDRLKKHKSELRDYKSELKIKKKYIYKFYSSMIPSLYIIKRPDYGIIQCKWKFLGITQKQLHVGTYKKVGTLDDSKLKEIAIKKINIKYSGTFTNLTLSWIKKEKIKLNKWCSDMNYRES